MYLFILLGAISIVNILKSRTTAEQKLHQTDTASGNSITLGNFDDHTRSTQGLDILVSADLDA